MQPPRVSIVLPTRNGAGTLPAVLGAIESQHDEGGVETIAVDSGSTDGSVEILEAGVDRLIHVSPADFDHGLTRNLGIAAARGDLVVLLVQDAIPQGDGWLTALTAPLVNDPAVAGAFARQVPRDDASRLARDYHARWVAAGDRSFVSSLDGPDELDRLSPAARHRRCAFDNVCSCLRRSVWERYPFEKTPIAEDLRWARTVLLAGHRIAFAADAIVAHSHDRPVAEELRRTRAEHEQLNQLFGLRQVPDVPTLAVGIATSMARHVRCEIAAPARLPRAVALAVAWPLGQYLGGRQGTRP